MHSYKHKTHEQFLPIYCLLATGTGSDLGLVKDFLHFFVFYLSGQFVYSLYFSVFSPVCFELSVPVQVIAWKDLSPI